MHHLQCCLLRCFHCMYPAGPLHALLAPQLQELALPARKQRLNSHPNLIRRLEGTACRVRDAVEDDIRVALVLQLDFLAFFADLAEHVEREMATADVGCLQLQEAVVGRQRHPGEVLDVGVAPLEHLPHHRLHQRLGHPHEHKANGAEPRDGQLLQPRHGIRVRIPARVDVHCLEVRAKRFQRGWLKLRKLVVGGADCRRLGSIHSCVFRSLASSHLGGAWGAERFDGAAPGERDRRARDLDELHCVTVLHLDIPPDEGLRV
mmetsp:Transcript_10845/g.27838  ORF Transcript_10845/g.27838 Transcript_10845/m.27838 type:complete len:262 (-) Transcript_10845:584-1369(-)